MVLAESDGGVLGRQEAKVRNWVEKNGPGDMGERVGKDQGSKEVRH